MKNYPTPRSVSRRGFTLVELLVVMSIIAILAALAAGGAMIALKRSKMLAAATDGRTIQSAIDRFVSEYSRLPSRSSEEIDLSSSEGRDLLAALMGIEESSDTMLNPRRIAFLSMREGGSHANGMIHNAHGTGPNCLIGVFDPWGNPFKVVLDQDQDDEIQDPLHPGGTPVHGMRALVYAAGSDKKQATPDDVKTW